MMRSKLLCVQKQPQEVFYKKGVLKNFAKFRRKHLCRCLPVNFAKFLKTPVLQNISGRLLLCVVYQIQISLL